MDDSTRTNAVDSESKIPAVTCFERAAETRPCPVGSSGACCATCAMGPCRLTSSKTGVCGATVDTVAARGFARSVAAGTAAHADHGRSLAEALLAFSMGNLEDLPLSDPGQLRDLARDLGVSTDGERDNRRMAGLVAEAVLVEFGRQEGKLALASTAPRKRQALWESLRLTPRGIDREVVETLHRTSAGTDQDAESLLDQALRMALADGWGGSSFATRIADAAFGMPRAVPSETGLGVLDPAAVNIVVHGHEPLLAEMLAIVSADPELVEKAKAVGATRINLAGICCTANEALMRRGIPSVGGVTQQEVALLTGLVNAMALDVQCVFQSLASIAASTGTALFTTSPKARIDGVVHLPLGENPRAAAVKIVDAAIGRFRKRDADATGEKSPLVAGFSLDHLEWALGGRFLASLKPLNDAVVAGYVRGIAAVVGCENPRVSRKEFSLVNELIRNNVLVVQTGCAALASARRDLMWLDSFESAGPLLKEICRHVGIPPVVHMGSCVDNSRILAALSRMVAVGGLGDDISDLPVVGLAPEWMSEKALAIGTYFAASGVPVLFGHRSPVESSDRVTEIMGAGWRERLGGSLEFESDPRLLAKKAIALIDERRKLLGITGFGLVGDERLGDKERKRQLLWWQKRLSNLLS